MCKIEVDQTFWSSKNQTKLTEVFELISKVKFNLTKKIVLEQKVRMEILELIRNQKYEIQSHQTFQA